MKAAKRGNKMAITRTRNEPDVSSASGDARRMTDAALVSRVKASFQKISAELPYIQELRNRFAILPRGNANIAGCRTWTEFCAKHLQRTDRQIRRVLADNCKLSVASLRAMEDVGRLRAIADDASKPTQIRTAALDRYNYLQHQAKKTIAVPVAVTTEARPVQETTVHVTTEKPKALVAPKYCSAEEEAKRAVQDAREAVGRHKENIDPAEHGKYDRLVREGFVQEFNYF